MLKKIAEECNVALSTVSTAFNHPEKISAKTRERIFEVSSKLGYFQQKHKIQTIGICTYGLDHLMWSEFYIHILEGILAQAEEQGIKLKFFSHNSKFTYETVHDVSGIIFLGNTPTNIILQMAKLKTPYLICADPNLEIQSPAIFFDNQKGAFLATEFLISKGHKNIALILSGSLSENFISRERLVGYKTALQKYNLAYSESYIFYGDYENFDLLETVLGQILQCPTKITAIFCESDVFAYKLLALSPKFSLQIPKDISIIGFDGISFPQIYFQTNQILTTIETDMVGLGSRAFKLLTEKIQSGNKAEESIILPVKLRVGDTVAENII